MLVFVPKEAKIFNHIKSMQESQRSSAQAKDLETLQRLQRSTGQVSNLSQTN